MPTPPPRKRFQFHLSTAIVMMFVAGGLIWANVRGYKAEHIYGTVYVKSPDDPSSQPVTETEFLSIANVNIWSGYRAYDYGWPSRMMRGTELIWLSKDGKIRDASGVK